MMTTKTSTTTLLKMRCTSLVEIAIGLGLTESWRWLISRGNDGIYVALMCLHHLHPDARGAMPLLPSHPSVVTGKTCFSSSSSWEGEGEGEGEDIFNNHMPSKTHAEKVG